MANQGMKISDISWKLDGVANASFVDQETTTAARDAAYVLREASLMLGIDPTLDVKATCRLSTHFKNACVSHASRRRKALNCSTTGFSSRT